MKYDDRILHECDCDFGTDNKIKSDDVYILNSAIRYANKQESSTEIDITRLCKDTEDSKLTMDVSYLSPINATLHIQVFQDTGTGTTWGIGRKLQVNATNVLVTSTQIFTIDFKVARVVVFLSESGTWDTKIKSDVKFIEEEIIECNSFEHHTPTPVPNFTEFYSNLVDLGIVANLNINLYDITKFFSRPQCFDFNLDKWASLDDLTIFDAYELWLHNYTRKYDQSDLVEFKNFFNILIKQGIISVNTDIISEVPSLGEEDDDDLMLPSIKTDNIIISTDGDLPKVKPGEAGYSLKESVLGESVDAYDVSFLVSDPGVKVYYDWDGSVLPRSWKKLGIIRLFKVVNNEMVDQYDIIEPPLSLLAEKSLPTNYIPLGTHSLFNGKTISIDNNVFAVSTHYSSGGAILLYEYSNDAYSFVKEVEITSSYENHLPIVLLSGNTLFVSDFTKENSCLKVYTSSSSNISDIKFDYQINSPINVKRDGFGSSLATSLSKTYLAVGNPSQYITKQGNIDQYNVDDVDYYCGAVHVYKKDSFGQYKINKTIFPEDLESFYIPKDNENGSLTELEFGYSIDFLGDDTLLISSPNAYVNTPSRREGAIYVYKLVSDNWEFQYKFSHDDTSLGTINISSGNFRFGIDFKVSENKDSIYIMYEVPNSGTFIGEYKLENGTYKINSNDKIKVADNSVRGYIEISNNDDVVFGGSPGYLFLLSI